MQERLLQIGRVTSTYGTRGWLKIYSYTEPIDNILNYRHWVLESGGVRDLVDVTATCRRGKHILALFLGVTSVEEAVLYKDSKIFVSTEQLPKLECDEYYWHQLIGLQVQTQTPAGRAITLGAIESLLSTGANDVMVVKATPESIDEKKRLIPYTDMVVKRVDLSSGILTVQWDPEL